LQELQAKSASQEEETRKLQLDLADEKVSSTVYSSYLVLTSRDSLMKIIERPCTNCGTCNAKLLFRYRDLQILTTYFYDNAHHQVLFFVC